MNGSPQWVPLHLSPLPSLPGTISFFLPSQILFPSIIRWLMSKLTPVPSMVGCQSSHGPSLPILQERTVTLTVLGGSRRSCTQAEVGLFIFLHRDSSSVLPSLPFWGSSGLELLGLRSSTVHTVLQCSQLPLHGSRC